MQEPHVHQRLNKSALRCHIADYLQENKTMEKLGEEMEDSGILNNNERLKGANYARYSLSLVSSQWDFKKKKR